MNVYDFDKTIYPVDSTVQFYRWCLRRYPVCRRTWPSTLWGGCCLITRLQSKTQSKQRIYRFLQYIPPQAPVLFWQEHIKDIQPWYLAQQRPDDLIISAGPEFLLAPVAEKLGFALIASPVEQATGLYQGENCHGQEKVRRFREQYGNAPVEGFWSDSLSDTPMAQLAQQAYRVRKGVVGPW
jgi:HAD superfamily phosphoserine phosphatase-like hydrolase